LLGFASEHPEMRSLPNLCVLDAPSPRRGVKRLLLQFWLAAKRSHRGVVQEAHPPMLADSTAAASTVDFVVAALALVQDSRRA
jgi:hypothetical protein